MLMKYMNGNIKALMLTETRIAKILTQKTNKIDKKITNKSKQSKRGYKKN